MRKKITIAIYAVLGISAVAVALTLSPPSLLESVLEPSPMPFNKAAEPEELLQRYFACVSDGQYEDMYEMLTEQHQEAILKDDFVAKNKSVYGGIEAKNITVTIARASDDAAHKSADQSDDVRKIVEYSLRMETLAGEISYNNQAVFALNEDKEYRMLWTTRAIFPNLNSDDKVRVRTLSANRGCIYDRNGEMLAGPGVASAIGFVPGKMRKEEAAPQDGAESEHPVNPDVVSDADNPDIIDSKIAETEPTVVYNAEDIAKVAELLEMTPESVIKKLNASYVKDDTFVQLKIVSKEAYELEEELLTVTGILISDTPARHYPLGEKASHLVGYIQSINAEELEVLRERGYHMNSILGKAGLEKIYEDELRAVDGYEVVIVDDKGALKESLAKKDKVEGKDVTLTIDAQMQCRLYDLFSTDKSCSIAMNPKTGEALALVSTPTYDANDFVLGMSSSKWTSLNEDENLPFLNRFKAALCPGSTMKAITAAIAIDTGIVSPDDDFGHSGLKWRKDETWGGYYIATTMEYEGPANIQNALKFSDNIFFGKTAMQIGAERFGEELLKIGFEERIPFEYGLYSSIVSTTETFRSEIQLADSGFGQGEILTNPIHLASVYSSFLNDGNILAPHLVLNSGAETWKENAFSSETARIIRDDLIQVIESGSATDAKVSGRILGGKTGTAEVKQSKDDKTGTELGWFVQFTAGENEENPLIIVSMVEDVKGRGGSHYVSTKVKTLFE
jgi:penicillin-binding protein